MTRIARILALLAFCCAAFTGCAGGNEPEATAAEQAIQSTCVKAGGDPLARYPWEATYPLGTQRVFCQHMDTETASGTWPAGSGPCTGNPNGGQVPGAGQVDVWVQTAAPATYRCTRITLPSLPAHFHLSWEPMLEWGWLSRLADTDSAHYRWIQGVYVGPGAAATIATGSADPAGPAGCPWPPTTSCDAGDVPAGGQATWVQSRYFTEGVDFHRN